ncbi:hypothetical protein PhCBS80983_g01653 [Powellomyces hirtus]|uniref:Uncharacterized protein n=1 Tax=Powellomyces hirtus TaxID=109895 RepID=A0A507EA07_9FUNG|nr:hypothetical protein PhCBS80983_g01653 [Powellomyces hirtus]
MDSIPADWPPTSEIPPQSQQQQQQQHQDTELLIDEHHQLAASDLLEDDSLPTPAANGEATMPSRPASGSADALPEDVTLGNESPTQDVPDLMLSGPVFTPTETAAANAPPMARDSVAGFDDVSATAGPQPGMPLSAFSAPGSLLDVQPFQSTNTAREGYLQQHPVADDGPIPFVQAPTANADVDFFASLPDASPDVNRPLPTTSATMKLPMDPLLEGVSPTAASTTSPSGTSPSAASIISLETASTSGQRPISADKSLPTLPPHQFMPQPVKPDRRPSSFFTPSFFTSAPPLDPKFAHLPTCRWIDPTVFYDIPPRDPVGEIFPKAFPATGHNAPPRPPRKLVRVEDVQAEPDPLLALVSAHSWRAVASYCRAQLIQTHPTDIPVIMRLWFVRIWALTKLKLHEFASSELNKIAPDLNAPQFQYEAYPDIFPGRTGSMISFEIRMFWARMPALKGRPMEAINRLYALLHKTRWSTIPTDATPARSATRAIQLQLAIANIFLVDLNDHRAATAILLALTQQHPTDANLASSLGRLYLQVGNVPAARAVFARHTPTTNSTSSSPTALANSAFLSIAEGLFSTALPPLTALLAHATTDQQPTEQATHVNNLALAHLYTGNVSQAVSFLDSVVVDQPRRAAACEDLLFNLTSLYDLCDCSVDRKRKLVAGVVARFAGDGFNTACLKF